VHTNNEEPCKILYSLDAWTLMSCGPFCFGRRGIKNEVHTRLLGSVYLELHCSLAFFKFGDNKLKKKRRRISVQRCPPHSALRVALRISHTQKKKVPGVLPIDLHASFTLRCCTAISLTAVAHTLLLKMAQ